MTDFKRYLNLLKRFYCSNKQSSAIHPKSSIRTNKRLMIVKPDIEGHACTDRCLRLLEEGCSSSTPLPCKLPKRYSRIMQLEISGEIFVCFAGVVRTKRPFSRMKAVLSCNRVKIYGKNPESSPPVFTHRGHTRANLRG